MVNNAHAMSLDRQEVQIENSQVATTLNFKQFMVKDMPFSLIYISSTYFY